MCLVFFCIQFWQAYVYVCTLCVLRNIRKLETFLLIFFILLVLGIFCVRFKWISSNFFKISFDKLLNWNFTYGIQVYQWDFIVIIKILIREFFILINLEIISQSLIKYQKLFTPHYSNKSLRSLVHHLNLQGKSNSQLQNHCRGKKKKTPPIDRE